MTADANCTDEVFGHACDTDYWSIYPGSVQWTQVENDLTLGEWHLFQFEFQDGSIDTADGMLKWWVDGKLIFDHSDIITRTSADPTYKRPMIVGFYNSHSNGADGNDHFYIDDAYIDNTFARVEIGDNSSYDNCTSREIQPIVSWSTDSVTIEMNQGSFNGSDEAYVFVIDENGTVSEGYPMTISSGNPADTNEDGTIQTSELRSFVIQWKTGIVTTESLFSAIQQWK